MILEAIDQTVSRQLIPYILKETIKENFQFKPTQQTTFTINLKDETLKMVDLND